MADIVTGHFAIVGGEIEVSLEAIDAVSNSVVWRDTFRGTTRDLIGLQQQITARVQHGLIEALGVSSGTGATVNASHNPEAYELYLRGVSARNTTTSQIPLLGSDNTEAIRLLRRAVTLDPSYASAWAALGHLYYYDSGEDKRTRLMAKAALQRAVALDSNRFDAASDLITIESEEGELDRAYDDITRLLHRHPDSGAARLVYSYVLWYAGLLEEAAAECEKTRGSMREQRTWLHVPTSLWPWVGMAVPKTICSWSQARNIKKRARWGFFCAKVSKRRRYEIYSPCQRQRSTDANCWSRV